MKTKIELQQAINNLTRLNSSGSYTNRINMLQDQLDTYPKSNFKHQNVFHDMDDKEAIILFNSDKQFKITE